MGAWGTGLLENDVAADARLAFDDALADGGSVDDAIAAVMAEWEDALDDPDDRADLVLALALLASEQRAIPAWLEQEAREVIGAEQSIQRWEEEGYGDERRAAERELLEVLNGTVPHPGRPGNLMPE